MSAIASFYLIDDEKRDDLIEAAQAAARAMNKRRWGIFRPKLPLNPDPFWDFLCHSARELEEFPYSGFVFCDIGCLAPEALSSDDELGKRVCEITDPTHSSTFITYRPSDVARALDVLRAADFSEDTIGKLVREDGREGDCREWVETIRDSVNRFTRWLEAVTEGQTGLLDIG